MNILIAGNLAGLTITLAKAFLREGYRVVCAGINPGGPNIRLPNVTTHLVSPTDPSFLEILSAYRFDAVVYISTREEQLLSTKYRNSGQVLDGLLNTLEICSLAGDGKFFYISSTEVYGNLTDPSEQTDPQPASANGSILRTGEQHCQYYSQRHGLSTIVIRIPFLFGMDEKDGLLYRLLRDCRENQQFTFPAGQDTLCSFLGAEDVADFILRALDASVPGYQWVNLSSADPMTLGQLSELLKIYFPDAQFAFDETRAIFTRPALVSKAKKLFDWVAVDPLSAGLPNIIALIDEATKPKASFLDRLKEKVPKYPVYLMWAEVVLGALAMNYLMNLSGSLVEFRYVDFRLIYVVLMGSLYGTRAGLAAAGLAGIAVLSSWSRLGLDWTELVYNVANWLPFAVYITAGAITGYLQDKKENDINFQNEQNHLFEEKYSFLHTLYRDVCRIKDEYHHQLVGSRDSFGRIFSITSELDTLEEVEVLYRALSILEDLMDTQNIAIYSIDWSVHFARLEMSSSALHGQIASSLSLANWPDLVESIDKGQIFQNHKLLPKYPAYLAPINNDGIPVAAVMIWETKFEHYSLYYHNLFKVLCGLIQSSVNRAILFMNANTEKSYVPSTHILQPEPFMKILRIRNRIAKKNMGNNLLVKVRAAGAQGGPKDWGELYATIAAVIRAGDYVGMLDDGRCCILFTQADSSDAAQVHRRLEKLGICIEPLEDSLELLAETAESRSVYVDSQNENILGK